MSVKEKGNKLVNFNKGLNSDHQVSGIYLWKVYHFQLKKKIHSDLRVIFLPPWVNSHSWSSFGSFLKTMCMENPVYISWKWYIGAFFMYGPLCACFWIRSGCI